MTAKDFRNQLKSAKTIQCGKGGQLLEIVFYFVPSSNNGPFINYCFLSVTTLSPTVTKKKLGLKQFPWIKTIFMFLDPN